MAKVSFEAWMEKVDQYIANELGGLTSEDLRDRCWMDFFEAGADPVETAKEILEEEMEEAGFGDDFD